DELVAVQGEHVAVLTPRARRVAQPAAAPEPLRLLDCDDLGADPAELTLEERALARRAREDHPVDAGACEPSDLVRRERRACDLDERLRTSARSVAEPLGLTAGEDDRLHPALRPRSLRPRGRPAERPSDAHGGRSPRTRTRRGASLPGRAGSARPRSADSPSPCASRLTRAP